MNRREREKFCEYLISWNLENQEFTIEDAWLEYTSLYPRETENIRLQTVLKLAEANDWEAKRKDAVAAHKNRFAKHIGERTKSLQSEPVLALSEKTARELALLEAVTAEIVGSFNLAQMSEEGRLKLLDLLLKHSSRISDSTAKMLTALKDAPIAFAAMFQAPTLPQESPTSSDEDSSLSLTVSADDIGIMKNVLDGQPVARVKPPSSEELRTVEVRAREVPVALASEELDA